MRSMNPDTLKSERAKYLDGLTLFEESVLKPDHKLRECAKNQGCYDELMRVREDILDYLHSVRKMAERG